MNYGGPGKLAGMEMDRIREGKKGMSGPKERAESDE